ncbi:MAG: DUF4012 domain-containing protein [Patescibacteria group bacterium]|nr:DUF4012 domain-containing protein [Patescibacteria group bacterium]
MLKKKKQPIIKKAVKKTVQKKKTNKPKVQKAKKKKILASVAIKKKQAKPNKKSVKKLISKVKKTTVKPKKTAKKKISNKKIKTKKIIKKNLTKNKKQRSKPASDLIISSEKKFDNLFALSIKNLDFLKNSKELTNKSQFLSLHNEKIYFAPSVNEEIKINYDLSVFSKSLRLINFKDKNTIEIKKIIKNKANIDSSEKNKYSNKKYNFFNKEFLINKTPKTKAIKQNFLKKYTSSNNIYLEDKIGFWKILFFPFYTFFRALENFFIDFSKLGKGRLPEIFKFSFPLNWKNSLAFFAIICFALLLPFEALFLYNANSYNKGLVLGNATTALNELKLGGKSILQNNLKNADCHFYESLLNFSNARQNLEDINSIVIKILEHVPIDKGGVSSGKKLICFGENIAMSAIYINKILETAQEQENLQKNNEISINDAILPAYNLEKNLIKKIELAKNNIFLATEELKKAKSNLDSVNFNVLPEQEKKQLAEIKEFLPILISCLDNFNEFLDFSLEFLGKENFKRYLIIFQNNYELRATGGFIGSFAMVDINGGKIEKIEIPEGGSYDLQGGLLKSVSAPEPLYLISPLWQFHDANWWPDFPTSAKKMMWFYENSQGPTVDGVIALNPQIIIELLKITGPIIMKEYDEIISADNFMWATEYNIELRKNKEYKPKKFIADLSVKLFDKLLNQSEDLNIKNGLSDVMAILDKTIKSKDLQLYFNNAKLQNLAKKYGLSGEIKQSDGDYLMVVNSNIAGGKTDSVISQSINLDSVIQEDGSVINQLTIKREHNGDSQDYFQRVRNVDWMRIYVPEGSQIISASGFKQPEKKYFNKPDRQLDIDEDLAMMDHGFQIDKKSAVRIYNQFGKTVFANWSMIDVGETAIIKIKYKLPFKIQKAIVERDKKFELMQKYFLFHKEGANLDEDLRAYIVLIQKQAGIDSDFNYKLNVPDNWKNIWSNNASLNSFSAVLDKDTLLGSIFEVK